MRQIKTANYIRVDKTTARALYKTGQKNRLFLCPVNLNPESLWNIAVNVTGFDYADFDTLISSFEYYNCNNSETGRYTAFYVPREWYELKMAANKEWNPDRAEELLKQLEAWEAMHP